MNTSFNPLRRAGLVAGLIALSPVLSRAGSRTKSAPRTTTTTSVTPTSSEVSISSGKVGSVPSSLKLPSFYKQYSDAGGLPVVASSRPAAESLLRTRAIVLNMLAKRADVLAALKKAGVRVAVIGKTEVTTDIPEYANLVPKDWWNTRTRGVGATTARPVCSSAEENLLGLTIDKYVGESILIHEFGHTLFEMGVRTLDTGADARLNTIYQAAMAAGKWQNTYAATDYREYWAEGVQCWFGANPLAVSPPNGVHGPVSTRADLVAYDPNLAAFISGVFGGVTWQWDRPGVHAFPK